MKKEKNNYVLTEEEKKEIMEGTGLSPENLRDSMLDTLDNNCEAAFGISFTEMQARNKAKGLPVETVEEAYERFIKDNEELQKKEAERAKQHIDDESYDLPF